MKEERFQQYAIVQSDSAEILTERLNQKLRELKDKDPVVSFDGTTARIQYVERSSVPEDIEDEWRLKGVCLTCESCPYFKPNAKSDGSVDMRSKKGMCLRLETRQLRDMPACDELYRMLREGEVGLCLKK